MINLRWANKERVGICYDAPGGIVVYLDAGQQYENIISGGYAIGEPRPGISIEGEPESKTMTRLQFFDLFTTDEWSAVLAAKKENIEIEMWYDRLLAADFVSFSDERLLLGLDALVSFDLITSARKSEILNA